MIVRETEGGQMMAAETQGFGAAELARFDRARRSRDARFDGTFFMAVTTTGIYCRPVCPSAPAPRRKNVRYFPSAAAAAGAGYRPCKRCRPEASAGTPAWLGSSAVVSRALRLIDEGALDDSGSVAALARRLTLGERQLRRLFDRHLGASPAAVARNRRVHFSRRLLEETDLRIIDVAYAAGFGSLRAFNEAFRQLYGVAPREARAARSERSTDERAESFSFRLSYRPPYDWDGLLRYLAPRLLPGVETCSDGVYRRVVEWQDGRALVSVTPEPTENRVRLALDLLTSDHAGSPTTSVAGEAPRLLALVTRIRRMFDLGADPRAVGDSLGQDRLLGPLLERDPGVRIPVAWDPFELAVRAVLGQQVSVAAAVTLARRLVERWGDSLAGGVDPELSRLFPSAATLAKAELEQIGLPARRAQTLRSLARCVVAGEPLFDPSGSIDEITERLCALPGIGHWTAHYIALRGLGVPDAFPAGDLGLRKALATNGKLPGEQQMKLRAEAWRPWRGYAAILLWQKGSGG